MKSLLTKASAATGTEQQKLYNECFDIAAEEAVYYPFLRRHQVTAYDKGALNNFRPLSTGGMYCLETTLK